MAPKILALGPLLKEEMDVLDENFSVIRLWKEADMDAALREHGKDVQGMVSLYNTPVSARLIEALPNLEIISQFGVGYDNIALETARVRQIPVTNTPDILTDDTADIAFGLMITLMRRLAEGDMYVRVGKWQNGPLPLGASLGGKTVGIVGLGRIGRAVAKRCEAFGMTIAYTSRTEKEDVDYLFLPDINSLAARCDILIPCVSGGPETEKLVDYSVLKLLGPKGYLVNISRGPVVDEDDLLAALSNRDIAGAGLDVFWREPNVPEGLIAMDNVVLTPHIGSATHKTRHAMGQLVIENLLAHFRGDPLKTPIPT